MKKSGSEKRGAKLQTSPKPKTPSTAISRGAGASPKQISSKVQKIGR